MFICAVISCVSGGMGYTSWTLEMCQYDYRAHELANCMLSHVRRELRDLWLFAIQDSK